MNELRKRRLIQVGAILLGVGAATALAISALGTNMNHFYSPSDILDGKAPDRQFRIGGIVLEGSTERPPGTLKVNFMVTDRFREVPVRYEGILPDLFREGQSVIATGVLAADGAFEAREVLAKHDENYMPAEVADAIARAQEQKGAAAAPASGYGDTP
jgi:cytochrome c-type biogenesis protein CcmE